MLGCREHRRCRAGLHDPAAIHDGHALGELGDDRELMGHEDHGQVAVFGEIREQVEDLRLDGYIERADRLVRDEQLGLERERAGDGHALALATRQLARAALRIGAGEPDRVQQLLDECPRARAAVHQPVDPGRLGDRVPDGDQRVE